MEGLDRIDGIFRRQWSGMEWNGVEGLEGLEGLEVW